MEILDEINRVLNLEIDTLNRMSDKIDQTYVVATNMVYKCQGKLIVTGTGKSGLIGRKISATMVSTGTPSIFLHPNDALHGDVGIVDNRDLILAISKSGESDDIGIIIRYAKSIRVPVIAVTAEINSTLGKEADVVLETPVSREACPLNLAPTSSTTAALVVGDMLAMTVMKMRDFRPEQFATYHPGGQLGKRLIMIVEDIMRSGDNNPLVNVNDTVREMLLEITSKRSGAVSVVDDYGHLLGLVTDFDIRQALERQEEVLAMDIVDIMNPDPIFLWSNAKASKACELMENRNKPISVAPVVDQSNNRVVGMLHVHDILAQGL